MIAVLRGRRLKAKERGSNTKRPSKNKGSSVIDAMSIGELMEFREAFDLFDVVSMSLCVVPLISAH